MSVLKDASQGCGLVLCTFWLGQLNVESQCLSHRLLSRNMLPPHGECCSTMPPTQCTFCLRQQGHICPSRASYSLSSLLSASPYQVRDGIPFQATFVTWT